MKDLFLKLASQGRKYKSAPFIACQTLSQFAVKLGESFVDATLGTIDQIAIRENITPDQMQSPNYSFSESVTRQEVAVATEDDIMFNPFKFSYCRLVPTDSGSKKSLVQPYSSAVFESVAA